MQSAITDIRSHGAGRVRIRPLPTADRAGPSEELVHLSKQTKHRRFGTVAQRPSERDLDRLADIDHPDHEAIAAIAPGTDRIVGVARYIALPDDPGAAEVAVEVDNDCQGRGLGRRLIDELVTRARTEGITCLLANVSTDNLLVRGWIARAGGLAVTHDGDATVYSIPLEQRHTERRAA